MSTGKDEEGSVNQTQNNAIELQAISLKETPRPARSTAGHSGMTSVETSASGYHPHVTDVVLCLSVIPASCTYGCGKLTLAKFFACPILKIFENLTTSGMGNFITNLLLFSEFLEPLTFYRFPENGMDIEIISK